MNTDISSTCIIEAAMVVFLKTEKRILQLEQWFARKFYNL